MLSSAPVSTETPSSRARRLHPRDRRRRPARGPAPDRRHPLSPGAERLPPHRPRQVDLPQLRHRPGVRRPLPPALRRHQPHQGRAGVHRRHRGRRALARVRLGRAPLLRLGLLRAALRVGRRPHQGRQGLRRRPVRRRDPRAPRHVHRARPREPLARPPAEESLDLFARMRAGEFPDGARVLRAKIDMAAPNINLRDPVLYRIVHASTRARATPGASTRPTTSPTGSPTRSRASRTRSARSSSRTTGRSTTGSSTTCRCRRAPPVRVRAPQPHAHRPVQARAAAPRQRGPRARLGRPAHADPLGPAPARLPAEGIRDFVAMIGVAKTDSVVEVEMLEHAVRNVLNRTAARRFASSTPSRSSSRTTPRAGRGDGGRQQPGGPVGRDSPVPFTRELWIERDDFMEEPRGSSSAWPPAARCGCGPRTS
jgi:hypothetical protein